MNFLREDDRGYNVFTFNCPHCKTIGDCTVTTSLVEDITEVK